VLIDESQYQLLPVDSSQWARVTECTLDGSTLRFRRTSAQKLVPVDQPADLLHQFTELATATSHEVREFANLYGPLRPVSAGGPDSGEAVDEWLSVSRSFKMMRQLVTLRHGRSALEESALELPGLHFEPANWFGVNRHSDGRRDIHRDGARRLVNDSTHSADWIYPRLQPQIWRYVPAEFGQGDHETIEALADRLIVYTVSGLLSRTTRPWFDGFGTELRYASLMGAVTTRLASLRSHLKELSLCAICGTTFPPRQRRSKRGQNAYCDQCKEKPGHDAMKRRLQRANRAAKSP